MHPLLLVLLLSDSVMGFFVCPLYVGNFSVAHQPFAALTVPGVYDSPSCLVPAAWVGCEACPKAYSKGVCGACTHLTMQSRMEFKEATFYKASSSFHYKGKGSILKPHTCCEYPDSLLEDGTLSAQVDIYDQNTHLANHYLGGAAVPLTLGDDSHLFGSETSEEYDFSIEEVKPTTKSLWSSLHTSLFAKKKLVDGELVLDEEDEAGPHTFQLKVAVLASLPAEYADSPFWAGVQETTASFNPWAKSLLNEPPWLLDQDFITEGEAAASRLAAEPRAATTPAAKPDGAPLHLLGLAALVVAGFLAGAARKGKPSSSGKAKALAERASHGALV